MPAPAKGRVQIKQYMSKQCRAPGCHGAASGFSPFCNVHKQAVRRHGEATQTGVTVHELRPYLARVEARKAKNPASEAWSLLEARWEAVVARARETIRQCSAGAVSIRHHRLAAHQLVTVADNVEPWVVVRTVLAMYLMQDDHPRRFVSDAAFDHQMVRRVRGLAPANAGTYWDHERGRTRRVYRDITPRVINAMAQPLKEALGVGGLRLADIERREAQRTVDERQRLAGALESLQ